MDLKVLRNDSAKRFPMLAIKKEGDVGLDLACTLDGPEYNGVFTVQPGERRLLPTGIRIELPEGYWASIEARSSTSKLGIIIPKGVIDEGYRGEMFAQVMNVGNNSVTIHDGDRIIQLIIHKRHIKDFDIIEVDELSPSERGEDGFGSTGR